MHRVVSLFLISAGAVLMIITTVRYHKLLNYNRQETYRSHKTSHAMEFFCLVLLYLFIAGFAVGAIDMLRRDVEPIYNFVVMIFFAGTCFIFIIVTAQQTMAVNLRSKTLEVMRTFVNAIDLKDSYTAGHSQEVYDIVNLFYEILPDSFKRRLVKPKLLDAALLHDIGKISIRDDILNKEDSLTAEEWEVLKTHPQNGKKMLDDTSFFEISDWVLYHHERVDGKGYYSLPEKEVPLESRIISIADTYSALCSDRIYRSRRSHEDAIRIMVEATGTQFDSELMGYFLKIRKDALQDVLH